MMRNFVKGLREKTANMRHAKNKVWTRFAARGQKIFRMNIASKILAGFLLIALMSTAMGIYAAMSLKSVNTSSKALYQNILQPTKNMASVMQTFEQECVVLRQGLLSSDPTMLPAIVSTLKNNNAKLSSGISSAKALIASGKEDEIQRVEAAYAGYKPLLETAIGLVGAGEKAQVGEDLAAFGALRTAEMELENALDALMSAVTSDAASMSAQNNKTADAVFQVTVIAVAAVLCLSVLIGIVIARGISKPVKKLTANMKMLAAGETDIALTYRVPGDEIGQMKGALETILSVIKELENDTGMLIQAAMTGELSKRADADKHAGTYRRIVEGINATLDAMLEPIHESAQVLSHLADGNLNVRVSGEFRGDFAIIKNALNDTVERLKAYIDDITYVLREISGGRLNVRIESGFEGDFAAIKDSLNESVASFSGVLTDINRAAGEVSLGTEQLSDSSQHISQGASEQSGSIERLTASMAEIARKTVDNAVSAKKAKVLSVESKADAQGGNVKIQTMLKAMQDIGDASGHISSIIKVIDDIAFQTNILALNAAVEAARAGVYGKGFAVVAEEVRNLAARSARAARETSELIDASIQTTVAGARIANETAGALMSIVSDVDKIDDLLAEIATASNDQAADIERINEGVSRLSDVVQNNTSTAQEVAAASQEIAAQAAALKQMAAQFTL